MRFAALSLLIILVFVTCQRNTSNSHFNRIDFTYFDLRPLMFNMRITENDSVFLRQTLTHDNSLKKDTTYGLKLGAALKNQLDSILANTNIEKLDTVYEDGDLDGEGYKIEIESGLLKKKLSVHSSRAPMEIKALKDLFMKIRAGFLPRDTSINMPKKLVNTQRHGKAKTFLLQDLEIDRYYLDDSVQRIFQKAYIDKAPTAVIDGVTFSYNRNHDTIMLPLSKAQITAIEFFNKAAATFLYGKTARDGAIIINTTNLRR